jgi:hypothetical protein
LELPNNGVSLIEETVLVVWLCRGCYGEKLCFVIDFWMNEFCPNIFRLLAQWALLVD